MVKKSSSDKTTFFGNRNRNGVREVQFIRQNSSILDRL